MDLKKENDFCNNNNNIKMTIDVDKTRTFDCMAISVVKKDTFFSKIYKKVRNIFK